VGAGAQDGSVTACEGVTSLSSPRGRFTDGPPGAYASDSNCTFLIAPADGAGKARACAAARARFRRDSAQQPPAAETLMPPPFASAERAEHHAGV
jgi:hypothetical protein